MNTVSVRAGQNAHKTNIVTFPAICRLRTKPTKEQAHAIYTSAVCSLILAFREWVALNPDPEDVNDEIDGLDVIRQIYEMREYL